MMKVLLKVVLAWACMAGLAQAEVVAPDVLIRDTTDAPKIPMITMVTTIPRRAAPVCRWGKNRF